jgi:energy-coupling factor transport system ATP-binding protein
VITFESVTVTYADAPRPAVADVDLHVPEGELCLVVGETGSGKSTLLRCINGLVPHFTGGRLTGRVTVDGRDTAHHPPRELADVVGYVGQVPVSGFVTDVVEDELAYAMESLGQRPDVMRRRVEETLDLLGLAEVRDRPLLSLSAGQQQRVAIGAVLTAQPRVLVLDEPTSALDPPAAEDVLATLTRLVHDLGLTVVVAEHRLERVVQYADSVVALWPGGRVVHGAPAHVLSVAAVRPPVVQLAQLADWHPLPLSVRDARRRAESLRVRLSHRPAPARRARPTADNVVTVRGVTAAYGDVWALRGVDVTVRAGEVAALMGRNGAGKSTLLALIAGLRQPRAGTLSLPSRVALVPQEPADLLWAATVAAECANADADADVAAGSTSALLRTLAPELDHANHPRDLSEGQRLMLCLAVMLVARPQVVALDEPTRGLDYGAKSRLVALLRELAAGGTAVVLATHDVELVAEVADRVVILADGEVVADGDAADVVTSSPAFAPQVAKVLAPLPLLTVDEARAALA